MDRDGEIGEGKCFRNFDEAMMAYQNHHISLQAKIKVRVSKEIDGEVKSKVIETTLGKLIFNNNIPQDLGFVDRTDPENAFRLEVEFVAKKKMLTEIVDRCIKTHGLTVAAEVLDAIKATGFKYSTIASLSISVYDMTIPPEKNALIASAEEKVDQITEYFNDGMLDDRERYDRVIATWEDTTKQIVDALQKGFNPYNPIKMMIDSGARGNSSQLRQLAGLRGLMFATDGHTMEIPIKSNFREGLNILDYFIGARGSRKSLSDTALKTADSGYLTRRLVDVSQEVIVREEDCHTTQGLVVSAIYEENDRLGTSEHEQQVIESLADRLGGRFVIGDVVDPKTGEVIVPDNTMITPAQVKKIVDAGITEVNVRSILRCQAKRGVCAHCYGSDLASGKKVNVGEAVGIIAAQSIGEPGTQLTMRTFHTGGIAGANITQGLPRIEELFEARRPKKTAAIAEIDGTISIREDKRMRNIVITGADGQEVFYPIPFGMHIKVQDGDKVVVGQGMTEGYKSPADILRIQGLDAVFDYIVREVQKVYRSQEIIINDKHIEVIARQMSRKVKVEDEGDTALLLGSTVDIVEFREENEKIEARQAAGEAVRPAVGSPVLLGITKASLLTESFLSAASFQETTKVLTEAAIRGKVDNLQGLKENVIIGKLIPAGTGLDMYKDIQVEKAAGAEE